jgi:hypothetical protein
MGEWDPSIDIAIALEEKLGVPRRSLLKKYDKLLGIPNRICKKRRKQKSIVTVYWEPLWVLREQLREAWGLSEENAVGRKHDTDPSLKISGGGRDDRTPARQKRKDPKTWFVTPEILKEWLDTPIQD